MRILILNYTIIFKNIDVIAMNNLKLTWLHMLLYLPYKSSWQNDHKPMHKTSYILLTLWYEVI